jgi:hypothetical protein
MHTPFAPINRTLIRAEAADRRHALRHLTAALCLALAGLMLAHMALNTLLALDDLAAQAMAARGM